MNFCIFNFNRGILFFIKSLSVILFILLFLVFFREYRYRVHYGETVSYLTNKYNDYFFIKRVEYYLPLIYSQKKCFRYNKFHNYNYFHNNNCFYLINKSYKTIMLIGDSHSASLGLGINIYLKNKKFNFLQVSSGWCDFIVDENNDFRCRDIINLIKTEIKKNNVDQIILSISWEKYFKENMNINGNVNFTKLSTKLTELNSINNSQIVVLGQLPIWNKFVPEIPNNFSDLFINKNIFVIDRNLKNYLFNSKFKYISIIDIICINLFCSTLVDNTTIPLAWDQSHLTEEGSIYIIDKVSNQLFDKVD